MDHKDDSAPMKIESIHTLVPSLCLIHHNSLYPKWFHLNNLLCDLNSMIRNRSIMTAHECYLR
jgi:hypothetical protein